MPFYIDDPDAPGKHADVIEVQLRNPLRELAPICMKGWMKRDLWTRREALLLLSGYDPHGTDWGGHTVVASHAPGPRVQYLDGTTDLLLRLRNVQHPRYQVNFEHILALSEYAAGGAINEKQTPATWVEWAAGKDFAPYWLPWVEGLAQTVPEGLDRPAQTEVAAGPGRTETPTPVSSTDSGPAGTTKPFQNNGYWFAENELAKLVNAGTPPSQITADLLLQKLIQLVDQKNCFSYADPNGKWIEWKGEDKYDQPKHWDTSAITEWLARRNVGPRQTIKPKKSREKVAKNSR